MKRLLLVLLIVMLGFALAGPAMAANGPPPMMTGGYHLCWGTTSAGDSYESVQFKASGTVDEGKGFIHYVAHTPGFLGGSYYFYFEVVSFHRYSDTKAACIGVLKATDTTVPIGSIKMVLWVEDNGQGVNAVADGRLWAYGQMPDYSPSWLTDWTGYTGDPVTTFPITSGNIKVH
jgi:hypothetical protein